MNGRFVIDSRIVKAEKPEDIGKNGLARYLDGDHDSPQDIFVSDALKTGQYSRDVLMAEFVMRQLSKFFGRHFGKFEDLKVASSLEYFRLEWVAIYEEIKASNKIRLRPRLVVKLSLLEANDLGDKPELVMSIDGLIVCLPEPLPDDFAELSREKLAELMLKEFSRTFREKVSSIISEAKSTVERRRAYLEYQQTFCDEMVSGLEKMK